MTSRATVGAADHAQAIGRRLKAERSGAEASLSDLSAQLQSLRSATIDSNGDDEHDSEGSTIAFEAAQLETPREGFEAHLTGVELAMRRLDSGTYGICTRCAGPIGTARLDALPATDFCVECAGQRR